MLSLASSRIAPAKANYGGIICLIIFCLSLPSEGWVQTDPVDCTDPVRITGSGGIIPIAPDAIVRADSSRFRTTNVLCLRAAESGYYHISATVEYSDFQKNESFYLQVCDEDGSNCRNACDPNAGPYRIINDVNAVADTLTRYTGLFFLEQGNNVLKMLHYVNVAEQYPQFINDAFEDTESVHLQQLHLERTDAVFDLALSQSASVDSARTGDEYEYQLDIENVGNSTVHLLTVRNILPPLTVAEQISVSPDSVRADTLFWSFDSLQAGENIEIGFSARVSELPDFTPFFLMNTAWVSGICDRNATNDTARTSVTIPAPFNDVRLFKTASRQTIQSGELFEYFLTVENTGPDPAFDVQLFDVIPPRIAITGVDLQPDAAVGDTLFWRFGFLAPGQAVDLTLNAQFEPLKFSEPFDIVNISGIASERDIRQSNDTASATVTALPPSYDLELRQSVSVDSIRDEERGQRFSYELTVTNLGPDVACDVLLWDIVADNVTFSDFTLSPTSSSGDTLFWRFDTLRVTETIAISFDALLADIVVNNPLDIINESRVVSLNDVNDGNNGATTIVSVLPPDDCVYLDRNVLAAAEGAPLEVNFQLSSNRQARLDIYDLTGYHIMQLADRHFDAGINTVLWNGFNTKGQRVGSGVYIITLRSRGLTCWTKVILAQ